MAKHQEVATQHETHTTQSPAAMIAALFGDFKVSTKARTDATATELPAGEFSLDVVKYLVQRGFADAVSQAAPGKPKFEEPARKEGETEEAFSERYHAAKAEHEAAVAAWPAVSAEARAKMVATLKSGDISSLRVNGAHKGMVEKFMDGIVHDDLLLFASGAKVRQSQHAPFKLWPVTSKDYKEFVTTKWLKKYGEEIRAEAEAKMAQAGEKAEGVAGIVNAADMEI